MKPKFINIFLLGFLIFYAGCSSKKSSDEIIPKFITPLGLENVNQFIPKDNPITKDKIALGRDLFFDRRLSVDGTVSCDFCHSPLLGFSDGRYYATGVFGLKSKRNTITSLNRIFGQEYFWDGRAKSIEEVVTDHIEDKSVFGNKLENVVRILSKDEKYQEKFDNVFSQEINPDGISKAIASFVRTLISGNSPYDKYVAGNKSALSESAKNGMKLFFSDRLKCSVCHSGPNFTDEKYHNNGTKIDSLNQDFGRYLVTNKEDDRGKFRTPTLRDISRSSPYMHNGSLKGIDALIDFYNKGGIPNQYQNPIIKPLHLNKEEKADLKSFLRSLTGKNNYFFGDG
ncbi:cytochrome-c peroxidase [Bacteroidota bacterium]